MKNADLSERDVRQRKRLGLGIMDELYQQSFDVFQRFAAVSQILEELGYLRGEHGILDVGGYPGTLGEMLKKKNALLNMAILDRPEIVREGYISGRAEALPFTDDAFDAVLCCDVLEHIPPGNRVRALEEMLRVCRGHLVIAAPFHSRIVNEAERRINELHQICSGSPNAWLKEHQDHGLPSLEEVKALLEKAGCSTAVYCNGQATTWFTMCSLQALMDLVFMAGRHKPDLSRQFNMLWAKTDDREPAYRHVVVADRRSRPICCSLETGGACSPEEEENEIRKIEAAGRVATDVARDVLSLLNSKEEMRPMLDAGYVRRVEEALEWQEQSLRQMGAELEERRRKSAVLEGSFLYKVLRKLKILP